jgi:hypothetical protein
MKHHTQHRPWLRKGAIAAAMLIAATKMLALPFGQWDFNSSNLTATVGSDLVYNDAGTGAFPTYGSTTAFGISAVNGTNATVMKFPGATNGMVFNMPTPPANGRGTYVDNYTLVLDVLYPSASNLKARPILETDDNTVNTLLGTDLAISSANGMGLVGGNFFGTLNPNTWYRIGFVVETNRLKTYIDGNLVGTQTAQSDRLVLVASSTARLLSESLTNSAASGYANSIQIYGSALNAGQMAALGAPAADGLPTTIPPVPSFVDTRFPDVNSVNIVEEPTINVVLNQGDTTVNGASVQLYFDGVAVGSVVSSAPTFTATYTVPPRLDPLSTHTIKLTWNDSVLGNKTNTWSFTVKNYQVITLPTPFYFQDFDSLTENATPGVALPAGWTVQNQTAAETPGFDLDDRSSDSYKDWILISSNRFASWDSQRTDLPTIILNGTKVTSLISGNALWAESDSRCGGCYGQFSDLFTASISCVGRSNVYVAFNSVYEQNQDNMDFMEYSVDGGTNWLPVLYYFDNDPANTDIILTNGVADVPTTFARVDVNRNWSPDTSPVHATNYGSYISAPISAIKPTDIHGRLNDDTMDGKRIEVIRLAAADGKANVRFRMNANGTSSWFWGIDNFGLYEITTPVVTTQPASVNVAAGTTAQFIVAASSPTALSYQWQRSGTNISNGGHYSGVTTTTLVISNCDTNDVGAYRCRVSNSSGTVNSGTANLTVTTVPTITTQPISVVVSDGYPASFSGAAFGGVPLTYIWRSNGVPISLGTSLSFASARSANVADYTLLVTNSYGSVTSRIAHLTVITVPVTNSLVAHLKFDGDYSDATGRGNNSTPVNGPGLVSGKIGSALQFTTSRGIIPAVTNYVTLDYPADLKFYDTNAFTVSFWTKYTNQNDDLALISNTQWDSSNNRGWGIFSQDGGNFRIKATTGAGGSANRTDITHSNVIRDGNWHHIVVVFEQGRAIYTILDGQALPTRLWAAAASGSVDTDDIGYTRTINLPPNTAFTGSHAINIGQDGTGWYNDKNGGAITNGLIDDVGFWRRALSAQEALSIYTAGQAGQSLEFAAQPASAGPLNIVRSGSNANFTWQGAVGVRLQKSTSLSPAVWVDVPGTTGASAYSEPATNGSAYYRLFKP